MKNEKFHRWVVQMGDCRRSLAAIAREDAKCSLYDHNAKGAIGDSSSTAAGTAKKKPRLITILTGVLKELLLWTAMDTSEKTKIKNFSKK